MTHHATGVIDERAPATTAPLGSRRASLSGHSLARLHAWADGERARGRFVATWNDPADGLAFAISGIAAEAQPSSLAALEAACSDLVEQQVRDTPEGEPCVYLGSRFDPARPAGELWSGWPGAWAVVPERTIIIHAGPPARTTAIVRGRDEAALDQALEALLLDLERAAPRPIEPIADARSTPLEARGAFEARVAAATAAIRDRALEKVVLARAVRHDLPRGRTWDVAATLDRLPVREGTIVLSVSRPGAGALVAATPELLVRVRGRRVEAPALAGTTRRGASLAEDEALAAALLGEPKARHEHALVAEAVRAALRPRCALFDDPGGPTVRRLAHLQHLETRLRGQLRAPGGALSIAAALHPTPALGGTPRDAALASLRTGEPLDRGAYAAPVGWLDAQGGGVLAAAIRCALLRGERAWSFAGAGVVAGSDPRAEWDETELKLGTIQRALGVSP
jgi:isochorismate synthase